MSADVVKLWVYFGDAHTAPDGRLTSDALLDCLEEHGLLLAALFRGVEGFGANRRIQTTRFPDVSTDLPLVALAVDRRDRIEGVLADVDRVTPRGLVTFEHARLVRGEDAARAGLPPGPGAAAKLTVFCGRAERARGKSAYRAIVDLLAAHGAAGATVLLGVDGLYRRRRARARLFSRNADVPLAVISVGGAAALLAALADLGDVLEEPVATLERISLLKHNGALLGEPPRVGAGGDVWHSLRIHTRQTAKVDGRPLYTVLTRRLRAAGAAGITTILGEWGFSGDERPYGDRLGLSSHMPTYTVYIDRPGTVAELWPIVDEVTRDHGIVTSLAVPGYRERAGEHVAGRLELGGLGPG